MLYGLKVIGELPAQRFYSTFVIGMLFLTFYITQALQSMNSSVFSLAVLLLQWMENLYSYKLNYSPWFISAFVQDWTMAPMRVV